MTIFLNYRRKDSASITGRIGDRLEEHFGKSAVYRDVESIPVGVDFVAHLERAVDRCKVLVAIIGPEWVSERLSDPEDFVRLELEHALLREIPIIPVLVEGAAMPAKSALPASLAPLLNRQALKVDEGAEFTLHMVRLLQAIEHVWPGAAWRRRWIAAPKWIAGGVAVTGVVLGVRAILEDDVTTPTDSGPTGSSSSSGASASTSASSTTASSSAASSSSGQTCTPNEALRTLLGKTACPRPTDDGEAFCAAFAKLALPGYEGRITPSTTRRVADGSPYEWTRCKLDARSSDLLQGLSCQLGQPSTASDGASIWELAAPVKCNLATVTLSVAADAAEAKLVTVYPREPTTGTGTGGTQPQVPSCPDGCSWSVDRCVTGAGLTCPRG